MSKRQQLMKILHLSDTHGLHKQLTDLPEADVIVHSGDFTWAGTEREVVDFVEWFGALPYDHNIFIAGNHDDCLHDAVLSGMPDNTHYLYNEGVTIDGVRFYGVPMFIQDDIEGRYDKMLENISLDTDVVITHQPPAGILDASHGLHYGSKTLLQRLQKVKPKFHLFGHIHDARGLMTYNGIVFANSAIVDEDYRAVFQPQLLQLGS